MTSVRMLALVAMAAVLTSGGPAWAGAPTDQLRERVDRVLRVLEDPELRRSARTPERRGAIRTIAHEIFDFREISQRSLARHWQARTAAERDEFIRLFADLLERSYVGKIEMYSGGERIQYTGESANGGQATVRTRIVTRTGGEIPVDYRMHRVDERWMVYDVALEGVSLVANYRAQFNKIIQTSSFKGLVDKLKAKEAEGLEADGTHPERASQK
ncbi:MAG TPA: ABC transporter substrate-binding protein [Methylomirabilota bacterium]|nr:ABC transporter substrate-binding protein [Methylomirabilota bacterium]